MSIVWKGYTWDVRAGGTGGPGYGQWSASNVVGPDGSNFVTMSITNPTGSQPVGSEISNQTTTGYGTYTSVVDYGRNPVTFQKNIVVGGMFPINNATPYGEFDCGETSHWDADFSSVQIDHIMWYGNVNSPIDTGSSDIQPVTSDQIVTNVLVWAAGSATFDTYAGTGTGGTNLFHSHYTSNVPAPNGQVVTFNLWVYANGGQVNTSATNCSIVLRDFSFVPAGGNPTLLPSKSDTTAVTAVATIKIVGGNLSINVSDTTTMSEVFQKQEVDYVMPPASAWRLRII